MKKEHEPEVDLMQQQKRQTDSLQFAQAAYEQQLDKNKSFTKLLNEFNGYVKDVIKSLDKENFEKFSTDGSGFAEVLEKMTELLEHVRKLHVQIAQRDFTVVKLQKVIEQLSVENRDKNASVVQLVGVRNGLLKSYMQLRKQYELLLNQNETMRRQSTNAVQALIDTTAFTYDQKLARALN